MDCRVRLGCIGQGPGLGLAPRQERDAAARTCHVSTAVDQSCPWLSAKPQGWGAALLARLPCALI